MSRLQQHTRSRRGKGHEAQALLLHLVQLHVEQGSESSVVLDLLMNSSSCLQVTEDYIDQQREAGVRQHPLRLVHCSMGDFQLTGKPTRQDRREEATDVMEEVSWKVVI